MAVRRISSVEFDLYLRPRVFVGIAMLEMRAFKRPRNDRLMNHTGRFASAREEA